VFVLFLMSLLAAPEFSQTTIATEPATVREGDVVTFVVRVRNTGDEGAPFTEVQVDLPLEAMFVDVTGLERSTVDPVSKVLQAVVDLPAGAEREFRWRMVVPREAGGHVLSPHLRVRYLHRGVEFYGGSPIDIGTRAATSGVVLGGIRFHPAAFGVLAVLALYPLLRVLTRRRHPERGPVVATVIAVGFWSLFAAIAYDDWRTVTRFRETTCSILDARMRAETEGSRAAPRIGGVPATTTSYEPLLALRYTADGREVISTGYGTGSRLSIGGASGAAREYERWKIGASVPCWFDPDDAGRVVVMPGFGGAYLFALFPLPLFAYGLWALASRRR
jgi:hypothetical protein